MTATGIGANNSAAESKLDRPEAVLAAPDPVGGSLPQCLADRHERRRVHVSKRGKEFRRQILERDGFVCHWCGGEATSVDYLRALVDGYHLSARDDVDGAVPVACQPKSGSFFSVGRRTVVKCSATDSSANTANVSFKVTVRATR